MPLGIIAVIIGSCCGYFLIAHFDYNTHFYSVSAYNVGQGLLASARFIPRSLLKSISVVGSFILLFIGLINLLLFLRNSSRDWKAILISSWTGSAVVFLLVVGIREVGADHVTLYALPLILIAVVSPAPLESERNRRALTRLACALFVTALLGGWLGVKYNFQRATSALPEQEEQKAFDIALAQALYKEGGTLVWMAYFQEYAWIPTMEAFYRYKALPLPAGGGFFEDHEALWLGHYPALSPQEVSERVYTANTQWVDIAVVFDDPARADTNDWMDNPYSRMVSKSIAERIRQDANWKRVFAVESRRYGTVVGYRNLTSGRRGYDLALRRLAQIKP
jgi:hypothetical protein